MVTYLIKSTLCLTLFLAFYHLVLEREKMHRFNRYYLLISVLISFLAPLYTIYIKVIQEPIVEFTQLTDNTIFTKEIIPVQEPVNYLNYLIYFSIGVSTILLIRFIKNLYSIYRKVSISEKLKHKSATIVLVADNILPHTFWNYIFINKQEYETQKIEQELFTHELTHVAQKHTFDVLLIELLKVVFWFNPIFYFLKKSVQLNHEFLADTNVVSQHKNVAKYQHLLINTSAWSNEYALASNLHYLVTKKRIVMMTKQTSKSVIRLKKIAVLPLLIGAIFLFAERVEAQEEIIETEKPLIEIKDPFKNVVKGLMTIDSVKFKKTIREKDTFSIKLENGETIKVWEDNKPEENIQKEKKNNIFITEDKTLKDIKLKLKDVNALKLSLQKDTIKKPITIKYEKLSASKSEMKEYNSIIERGKKDRLFKNKDIIKLQYLYSSMSKEQKNSVEDYASIIPPPPPPKMVKKGEISNIPPPPPPAPKVKKGEKSNIPPPIAKKNKKSPWKVDSKVNVIDVKEGKAIKKELQNYYLLTRFRDNSILKHKTKNYFINESKIPEKELDNIIKENIEVVSTSEVSKDEINIYLTVKK